MKRVNGVLIFVVLITALFPFRTWAAPWPHQELRPDLQAACAVTYDVKAGDWLSMIAYAYFNDINAYEQFEYYQDQDGIIKEIEDVDRLEIGWKVCVPPHNQACLLSADLSYWQPPFSTTNPSVVDNVVVDAIVLTHQDSGGSTYELTGQNMVGQALYAVSIYPDIGIICPGKLVEAALLQDFITTHVDLLSQAHVVLGTWADQETIPIGTTAYSLTIPASYIDVSVTVENEACATALGQAFNQIAIEYLADLSSINTGGTGTMPDFLIQADSPLKGLETRLVKAKAMIPSCNQ